jgi:hypothetical protein
MEAVSMSKFKLVVIAAVVALAAVAVLGVGLVAAQVSTGWGHMANGGMMAGYGWQAGMPAYGMMSGSGMMAGDFGAMEAMHTWMSQTGGMHTVVWDALAATLDLAPAELQAELAAGRTLAQIAETQGVDATELAAALETAMQAGLDQAVVVGALTQEQADQMLTAMTGRYGWMLEHMATGQMGAGMMGAGAAGGCHDTLAPGTNG